MANIQPEINAFKSAVYGEEVRDSMVSLANKVNMEAANAAESAKKSAASSEASASSAKDAVQKMDEAVKKSTEAATYAKTQGDYAKAQGDYAKGRGDYAQTKADSLQVQFDELEEILAQTVDGSLLIEIRNLLDDMYRTCTDADIDNIIEGTYTDEDDEGSIFDPASNEDIDDIIAGIYTDTPENESGNEADIDSIIDSLFN